MSKQSSRTPAARRDILNSPLLRKCSVHQKSRKVQRRDQKATLRKQYGPQNPSVWRVLSAVLPFDVRFTVA